MTKERLSGQPNEPVEGSLLDEIRSERATMRAEIEAGTPMDRSELPFVQEHVQNKRVEANKTALRRENRRPPSFNPRVGRRLGY